MKQLHPFAYAFVLTHILLFIPFKLIFSFFSEKKEQKSLNKDTILLRVS